jgi:hypothetical protein
VVDVIRSKTRKTKRQPYEFALEFFRDDTPEVHQFKAYPQMDAGSLTYTLSATHKRERALEGMVRSIRKMLADDDGTPIGYRPRRYVPLLDVEAEREEQDSDAPAPSGDLPEGWELAAKAGWKENPIAQAAERGDLPADDEDYESDTEGLYLGPDGEPHDAEFIQKSMTFEAGSSRRRFAYLMDEDEELTLEVDQLEMAYKRLVGKAAARPTPR